MSGIISCSFHLNLAVLKLIGLYPSKKYPVLRKVYGVSIFALLQSLPLLLGTLHFLYAEDLTVFNYNDYILVGMMFSTFKIFPLLKNGDEIKKCIEYFDDCVVVNSDQRLIIEECVSTCKRNSSVFIGGCCVTFVILTGPILVQGEMEKLPLKVWLPYVWEETLLIRRCVYFLLTIALAYATLASGSIDPIVGGLSHHAAAQLRVLGSYLRLLDQNVKTSNQHNIYKKIKMCIQQYQRVLTFVDKFQECFSPVVFSQMICSVLSIGLCCFQLVVVKTDGNFLVTVLSLGILFSEMLFYCYYGTLLMEENNALFRAVYMSKWYEYDEQSKRALLILMERLKKPLIVTAGKVLALSLDTFTTILKRSYSFAAILKNY